MMVICLGFLADDLFRDADEEVDPARHFHRRCGHDDGQDDEDHFAGDIRRGDVETNDQHQQSHRAPQAKSNPAHACPHGQRSSDDQKFED